jgi:hypothetical protein
MPYFIILPLRFAVHVRLKPRPTLPEKLEWARSRPLLNIPGPGGHAYVGDAHNGLLSDAGDFQAVELPGVDVSQDLAERLEDRLVLSQAQNTRLDRRGFLKYRPPNLTKMPVQSLAAEIRDYSPTLGERLTCYLPGAGQRRSFHDDESAVLNAALQGQALLKRPGNASLLSFEAYKCP